MRQRKSTTLNLNSSLRLGLSEFNKLSTSCTTLDDRGHADPKQPVENTYQTEPHGKFPVGPVRQVMKDVMENLICADPTSTDTLGNGTLTKDITSTIKGRVKQLSGVERFKIVVNVIVGQGQATSLQHSSRCLWNDSFDNYVQHTYSGSGLYAVATVYGVYVE